MLRVIIALVLVSAEAFQLLPLDRQYELDPEIDFDPAASGIGDSSQLVFSLDGIVRRVSILGWASELYDLSVGRVYRGELQEDEVVGFYVFPRCLYSMQFASLEDGCGVIVAASLDSTNSHMEGFRTAGGDWHVETVIVLHPQP